MYTITNIKNISNFSLFDLYAKFQKTWYNFQLLLVIIILKDNEFSNPILHFLLYPNFDILGEYRLCLVC